MLIGVQWGGGYSGCSSLVEAIESIGIHDQRIEVRVGPLPDLGECLAVVYPIQIVRIPRSDFHVVFSSAA